MSAYNVDNFHSWYFHSWYLGNEIYLAVFNFSSSNMQQVVLSYMVLAEKKHAMTFVP